MKYRVRGFGLRLAFVLTVAASLAACNESASTGSQATSDAPGGTPTPAPTTPTPAPTPTPTPTTPTPTANHAPVLSGTAPADIVAGQAYSFTPTATDADNDTLTFTIANKPAWASFDASTGRVSGTPTATQVGNYANIQLAATDGKAVAKLQFAVTVSAAPVSSSVSLAWLPPTENTDGTPIAALTGYKIHYGSQSGNYTNVITIANPGITRYVVDNLPAGTYYFAITAYTSTGSESAYSGEASTTIG